MYTMGMIFQHIPSNSIETFNPQTFNDITNIKSNIIELNTKFNYLYKLLKTSTKLSNKTRNDVSLYNIENRIKYINATYFKTILRHNYNTILISYPASGNSLFRILLEYTTLFWTGSTYRDGTVKSSGYKGESEYGEHVFIAKTHPKDWYVNSTYGAYDRYINEVTKYELKYNRSINMSYIFLIRNPFDVCWSFYQWEYGNIYTFNKTEFDYYINRYNTYYNVGRIKKSKHYWYYNGHVKDHKKYFRKNDNKVTHNYTIYVKNCFEKWNMQHSLYLKKFEKDDNVDLFVMTMQDMFDEDKMIQLLQYMFSNEYLYGTGKLDEMVQYYRLFLKNINDIPRCYFGHRTKQKSMLTKKEIYARFDDKFICELYTIVKDKMIQYGFKIPINVNCN